jgi:hypothetical protein
VAALWTSDDRKVFPDIDAAHQWLVGHGWHPATERDWRRACDTLLGFGLLFEGNEYQAFSAWHVVGISRHESTQGRELTSGPSAGPRRGEEGGNLAQGLRGFASRSQGGRQARRQEAGAVMVLVSWLIRRRLAALHRGLILHYPECAGVV